MFFFVQGYGRPTAICFHRTWQELGVRAESSIHEHSSFASLKVLFVCLIKYSFHAQLLKSITWGCSKKTQWEWNYGICVSTALVRLLLHRLWEFDYPLSLLGCMSFRKECVALNCSKLWFTLWFTSSQVKMAPEFTMKTPYSAL